jgi:hypothetical protein
MGRTAWNLVFVACFIFGFVCTIGVGIIATRLGDEAGRNHPLTALLVGGAFLAAVGAYVSYYQTTWRRITGGRLSLFVLVMLGIAAVGFILIAIGRALFGG